MNSLSQNICRGLIARKYEFNGEAISNFISLYLYTDDNQCYMIHLDDEDCTWRVIHSNERPNAYDTLGDEKLRYPHEDIAAKYNLIGKTISTFLETDKGGSAEAVLQFTDGSSLSLIYEYEAEKYIMEFKNK